MNRGGGTLLASDFGEGQAFADHLRNDQTKAVGIVQRIVFRGAIVVTENLFIDIAEQMKRFNGNVSTIQSALEETPEVLHAVSVNAPPDVFPSVVHYFVRVKADEFVVGYGVIRVQLRSHLDLIKNLVLQGLALHIRYNLRPNSAEIAVKHSLDGNAPHVLDAIRVYSLAADFVEVVTFALVAITHLSADERFIYFYFALSAVSELRAQISSCIASRMR